MRGIQIGQLLIEQGVLTPKQVQHVLNVQKMSHRPFGDLAERLYGIDPHAVQDAWVEQYVRVAGVVELEKMTIDLGCLSLLTRRQAWQFHLLPLHHDGDHVNMATSADHLVRAVNFATRKFEEPVNFLIADRRALCELLMEHYPVPEFVAEYAARM